MKKLIPLSFFFISVKAFSQDTAKLVNQIDSLVYQYNHTDLEKQQDTVTNSLLDGRIKTKVYLTSLTDKGRLKKYSSISEFSGMITDKVEESKGYNIFYFDNGHLIKVEEGMSGAKGNADMIWYLNNDILIHHNIKSDLGAGKAPSEEKIRERGEQLVEMAKGFLQKFNP
ncbi:MAG: hypothetical protein DI535_25290 [Citrobacter freundii]|nr:MAG: hypothetical protein DI535_25290 [Citrobacter freundii]